MQREELVSHWLVDARQNGTREMLAAALKDGPADGAPGTAGSPHGTESTQGLPPAGCGWAGDGDGDGDVAGRGLRAEDRRGAQQHDAPRHREPHLQWWPCSSSSASSAEAAPIEVATASARPPRTTMSTTTTGQNRRRMSSVPVDRGWSLMRLATGSAQEAFIARKTSA